MNITVFPKKLSGQVTVPPSKKRCTQNGDSGGAVKRRF